MSWLSGSDPATGMAYRVPLKMWAICDGVSVRWVSGWPVRRSKARKASTVPDSETGE